MSQQNRDGVWNPAYHHSETLEMDRGSPERSQHQNPYASEDFRPQWDGGPTGRGGPEVLPPYDMERGPWDTTETIPMRPLPSEQDFGERYPATSPQVRNGFDNQGFEWEPANENSLAPPGWQQNSLEGHQAYRQGGESSLRQRGVRKYSLFPTGTLSTSALERLGFKEDEFQDVLEEERQDLVRELAAMSSRDRVRAVRQLPMNLQEKDQIRKTVLLMKTSEKQRQEQNCCTDCSQNVSMSFRRCGASLSAVPQALQLWQGTLKEIGGRFGTSVLSYFLFLKWLLMFNIFSFLVNFSFITVPQLFDHEAKNTGTFRGLEILTGAGYFSNSVLYYGFYSNGTVSGGSASGNSTSGMPQYNMQLAYFFTIGAYLVLCCISLVYSAARSFRENFMLAGAVVGNAGRLLSSWDFSVVNEKAVRLKQDNLRTQLKESLAEKTNENLSLTFSQKLARFGIHVAGWLVSTGMAAGCCAGVYFLCCYNMNLINKSPASQSLTVEAGTLLLPVVVSLINLVIPLLYSLFKKVEPFTFPRHQIYALIIRNVLLKMSILAMLCYFWLEQVVENDNINCWETFVGQDIYRLIIVDFIFCLLGSFFGEFLHNVIGTKCLSGLGVPEFDIARNVLDLIYAQTLAWIGIFFSPLLPAIQIIKLFLIFYLKKVSLMQNCQPPKRSWRAAQMMTTFILLLFFPSFSGALSVVAFIVWRKAPSKSCGPFRGLAVPYDAVSQWMDSVDIDFQGSSWAVWIYNNLIKSVLFFLIITLLVLILIYLYWQIVAGRKVLIVLLQEQITNEGKDKTFLLEKIEKLKAQNSAQTALASGREAQRGGAEVSHHTGSRAFQRSRRRSQDRGSRGLERGGVSTVDQGSRSTGRGRMPEYEPRSRGRDTALPGYVQEGLGTTSMLGSEREYPGRTDYLQEDPYSQEDGTGPPVPSALVQALLARRQAEEEDEEEGY
ncbi:transmembrane channel-like protein 5 isoform X1 [Acipenser oxyrinchus oxyrinchus]|uniref:Transmembrane channel-like protein n=1 Tax=Acipenser oxyrinchus oxyrinchus TaxID=40147 RepID=A0AAD8G3N1_ACIOX|nr:transmembrane channel-like protein 5 isoform X1 [Acipenser oxyrinchus oxyrinchus]